MPDGSLIFEATEFQRRTAALQQHMIAADQDALLLTTPADIFYVTGFLTRFWESPARPWFVILAQRGDPIAVIPSIGLDLMQRTWVRDIHTWDAPFPGDDGVTLLADVLSGIVPENGAIGLPKGLETHVRMPLADLDSLTVKLAPRRLTDAMDTVQRVREIKSEAEIQKIRSICRIADRAFQRVPELVTRSPRLDHIFRAFQVALLEEGADWVSYVAGGAGPGGYGDVISPAAAQKLAPGDVLMLDTGAVNDGYFCDFDRNFSIGEPAPDVRAAHEALYDATESALSSIRPGMTARDVHALLVNELAARGQTAGGGRLGHGLGVTLTEWPSFTDKDLTPLRAGMVLTLEPSVEVSPGRLIVHEENIALREEGAELLSPRAPANLPVIVL